MTTSAMSLPSSRAATSSTRSDPLCGPSAPSSATTLPGRSRANSARRLAMSDIVIRHGFGGAVGDDVDGEAGDVRGRRGRRASARGRAPPAIRAATREVSASQAGSGASGIGGRERVRRSGRGRRAAWRRAARPGRAQAHSARSRGARVSWCRCTRPTRRARSQRRERVGDRRRRASGIEAARRVLDHVDAVAGVPDELRPRDGAHDVAHVPVDAAAEEARDVQDRAGVIGEVQGGTVE